MAKYIDREQALSHPFANGKYDRKNANADFIRGFESYKEWLEQIPTADVRENVHAHWSTHEYKVNGYDHAYCECSACNAIRPITLFPLNFCPNCGARMDGELWTDRK